MIPGIDIVGFIKLFGVLGVAAIIFAESGLLIGFFLPGDTLLFTAGFLAHRGLLNIDINVLAGVMFLAAAFGDSVGYAFGRRVGPRLFTRKDSILLHKDNIDRASAFYDKYGPKTIIIARFIPVIRTLAPIMAGVGKMNYKTFLIFNLVGSLIWGAGNTYLGYFVGSWFEARGLNIDHYLLPIVLLVILSSIAPPLYHIWRNPADRKQLQELLARLFRRRK